MLGFRGTSRYYDLRYRDGFALECQAMRQVRDDMGLTNVKLMIPFVARSRRARKRWSSWRSTGCDRGRTAWTYT